MVTASSQPIQVSVVVPTRNRPASLWRLLHSLAEQSFPLREVIVVDSSDVPTSRTELEQQFPTLHITYLVSKPSVCVQRNLGIRHLRNARSGPQESFDLALLCDDDVELPADYVAKLVAYLKYHPEVAAVSGLVADPGQTEEHLSQYPVVSLGELWFRFLFQLSIWGEIGHLRSSGRSTLLYRPMARYYTRKGNGLSGAGWPVITRFQPPVFHTPIWALSASIVRLEQLGDSPYDEVLDPHGLGDHYDLCLQLPGIRPVAILTDVKACHHKSTDNRLPARIARFRRTLALHYFLRKHPRFSRWNRLLFVWSLLGQYLATFHTGDRYRRRDMRRLVSLVLTNRNPYVLGWKQAMSRPRL